jgi:hypothetical protein
MINISLFAKDIDFKNLNKSLYKNFEAGAILDKKYIIKENEIDCKAINIPLANISECYIISENENLTTEKDFLLIISTINKKINTAHLIKTEVLGSLNQDVFSALYNNNLKSAHSFNITNIELDKDVKIMSISDLILKRNKIIFEAITKNSNFAIDTVFIDSDFKEGDTFNYIRILKEKPQELTRIIEIIETYDYETEKWTYRIDFINFMMQSVLQYEYNKLNNKNLKEKI